MFSPWLLLVLSVSAFAVLGNTLLKKGAGGLAQQDGRIWARIRQACLRPAILWGVAAYAASQFLWIAVLRVFDLSLAYPLQVGINFTMIMTVAWLYFKEPLSAGKLLGAALIFAGVVTMGTG